jgi:hypothetical protein
VVVDVSEVNARPVTRPWVPLAARRQILGQEASFIDAVCSLLMNMVGRSYFIGPTGAFVS